VKADIADTKVHVEPIIRTDLERKITLIYTDMGEYYNLKPIADEAERRGFEVRFTQDILENAEVGIYCQHVCFPENSKFSVILLHDLAQGHNRWPYFWELEQWNNFDIGILPGKTWGQMWEKCGCMPYARPRCGVFEMGYPKSDQANDSNLREYAKDLGRKLGLKYDKTILYAPSWENDGKEDDFVKALCDMPVNLLVKQAHCAEANDLIKRNNDNIRKMREIHEGNYENLYYIETKESIIVAILLCDMLVSDESSTMGEAAMFGKPSIAVTDWLIPDTIPSRYASVPMDYVIKCKKNELRSTAEALLTDPKQFEEVLSRRKNAFSNAGNVCEDIMDAIEYYAFGKTNTNRHFETRKLISRYDTDSLWN
jgi:hypothetical protein